jgi:ABC-type branched-subunit amino acid transport system substrate-binding protein
LRPFADGNVNHEMIATMRARLAENRWLAIITILGLVVIGIAVATAGKRSTSGGETSSGIAAPSGAPAAPSAASPSGGEPSSGHAAKAPIAAGGGVAAIPGLRASAPPASCAPKPVHATGVTSSTITIGQIVTDNGQVPEQFGPAHEGLSAFVKLFNASGGLCGRTLRLEYRNDNLNPATHRSEAQELANSVFSFVANESLLDFLDYDQNPPFSPQVQGGGGYVPDVGGLAFSYNRSQSAWHAGVIGSVSPVLIAGGQFRTYLDEARAKGTPCRKAAVVYLQEPTGASQDEAMLGAAALEASWGGNMGSGNTKLYSANLTDPEPAYETLVDRMVADGMNCVFTYIDVQSNVNLVQAMNNRGVWPPGSCKLSAQCFRVVWIPFSAYDGSFVRNGGPGTVGVTTFIPHLPFSEPNAAPMKAYLGAIGAVGGRPSTFSVLGFASGVMLVQALESCPAAPTRACVMNALRTMQNFTAGGLLGGTTPFKTTRATYGKYGTFDWKWIFYRSISMRVEDRNGKRDFYRISPASGFFTDTLHVARGRPG